MIAVRSSGDPSTGADRTCAPRSPIGGRAAYWAGACSSGAATGVPSFVSTVRRSPRPLIAVQECPTHGVCTVRYRHTGPAGRWRTFRTPPRRGAVRSVRPRAPPSAGRAPGCRPGARPADGGARGRTDLTAPRRGGVRKVRHHPAGPVCRYRTVQTTWVGHSCTAISGLGERRSVDTNDGTPVAAPEEQAPAQDGARPPVGERGAQVRSAPVLGSPELLTAIIDTTPVGVCVTTDDGFF